MNGKHPKKLILEALMRHPEGLTMVSLAEIISLHRHTSTKYLYELVGAGLVYQRKVGSARLCYLSVTPENYKKEKKLAEIKDKKIPGRKSQIKFIAIFSLLGIILASSAVIASSLLNQTFSNGSYTGEFILNLTNGSTILENMTVEIISNGSTEINDSQIPLIYNESYEKIDTNISEAINETYPIEIPPITNIEPLLNVDIEYPEKITRGEDLVIKAIIENNGFSDAKNVVANWVLPEGFQIISEIGNCGDLQQDASCTSVITVQTSLSVELGIDKIKFVVNYEA